MNTKTLRNLFNVFTEIVETNPADEAERNLYGLPVPCPNWAEDVTTLPALLPDGSLGLAIETCIEWDNELVSGPRLILKPDYESGRMVRA